MSRSLAQTRLLIVIVLVMAACTAAPAGGGHAMPSAATASPPFSVGPSEHPSSPVNSSPTSSPVAHFTGGGIGFDYPASWQLMPSGLQMHYIRVVAFVGTAPSSAACTNPTPNSTTCRTDFGLQPNTVAVLVETQDGPGYLPTTLTAPPQPGNHVVMIDGVPVAWSDGPDGVPGADRSVTLVLPSADHFGVITSLQVGVQGPDAAGLNRAVDELLASVGYEPRPRATAAESTAAAEMAIERALATLVKDEPAYTCMPHVPGTTADGILHTFPMYSALRKPLPVTCSIAVAWARSPAAVPRRDGGGAGPDAVAGGAR